MRKTAIPEATTLDCCAGACGSCRELVRPGKTNPESEQNSCPTEQRRGITAAIRRHAGKKTSARKHPLLCTAVQPPQGRSCEHSCPGFRRLHGAFVRERDRPTLCLERNGWCPAPPARDGCLSDLLCVGYATAESRPLGQDIGNRSHGPCHRDRVSAVKVLSMV
jgi:hypothetical protein